MAPVRWVRRSDVPAWRSSFRRSRRSRGSALSTTVLEAVVARGHRGGWLAAASAATRRMLEAGLDDLLSDRGSAWASGGRTRGRPGPSAAHLGAGLIRRPSAAATYKLVRRRRLTPRAAGWQRRRPGLARGSWDGSEEPSCTGGSALYHNMLPDGTCSSEQRAITAATSVKSGSGHLEREANQGQAWNGNDRDAALANDADKKGVGPNGSAMTAGPGRPKLRRGRPARASTWGMFQAESAASDAANRGCDLVPDCRRHRSRDTFSTKLTNGGTRTCSKSAR